MSGFDADVTSQDKARETVDKVDELLKEAASDLGILVSGIVKTVVKIDIDKSIKSKKTNNMSASLSTIMDTDFAAESANLVKAQILQNTTSVLLAQANSAPAIALRLLE